jgi:hypothetical protein
MIEHAHMRTMTSLRARTGHTCAQRQPYAPARSHMRTTTGLHVRAVAVAHLPMKNVYLFSNEDVNAVAVAVS